MSAELTRSESVTMEDAPRASTQWQTYVAACQHDAVVVGIDGLICAANEQLLARVGCCSAMQLENMPLTSLLAMPGDAPPPAFEETEPHWEALRQVLDGAAGTPTEEADGVAKEHAHAAREEAARKLITNHDRVVRDVTNPSPKTQLQLTRVSTSATPYVDQILREVARRLLGRQPGLEQLAEQLEPSSPPVQAEAWAGTARYMRNRTQATPDHNPGRKPDMSVAAAAAFIAVLEEVGGVSHSPLEELLLAGVQGRSSITKCVDIAWKGGGVDRMEVRVTPLYDPQHGSMQRLLIGLFSDKTTMLTQGLGVAKVTSSDASSEDMELSTCPEEMEVTECSSTPSGELEGLRNVNGRAQNLLHAADAATTAWAVVFASVLQKSMFKTVLLTRPAAVASSEAGAEEDPYEIWHTSRGLEEMLGLSKGELLGCDCTALCAAASSPDGSEHELHRAVASRTGSLIETVLTTSSGSPLFCLAYVMPLHCHGARNGSTAVAFLDVHRSLPYMQKQMESRDIADCDLYTFVKFSLLNCLVTDPSAPTPTPAERNPIVFASAGFSAMSGATTEECLGRNCRFLQTKYMGLRGREGEAPAQSAEQLEAISHMAGALDARQESLTLLTNFRVDGSRFTNLLFMTPIAQEGPNNDGGVLFWVGVQHPVDEAMVERVSTAGMAASTASINSANHMRLLRSCQQSLQSLQLQELYSEYTSNVHRRSIAIHSSDPCCAASICRLCEHPVLAESMSIHTPMCKVVSQCRSIVEHADGTLARVLCKLNAATSSAFITGSYGSQSGQVVELLRTFTSALLGVTASSQVLTQLSALPSKLEELIEGPALPPATALCWIDIKAAGQRKLAALQHAVLWTSDLVQTIVPRADDDPLSHGQAPTLQDFEVVRELQRGSHAAVYMVRKVQTGDVFAMKVLDTQRAKSYRLATERKILFSCNSPFVIRTFYAFEDASRLFLVMECMHSDVKNLLQKLGVIPEQQAVSLMADLVLALEHMHGCGVYHRDLKPENLLLTSEGRLKLADFGLSHVVATKASPLKDSGLLKEPPPDDDDTARDPSIVGTPFYMAPEVIQGKARGIEVASEWWSCGVIMYEFLTGFPPFQGRKVAEIYRAILKLAFVVDIRRCNVSAEAADLVQRLLVVEPRSRLVDAPRVKAHPFFRGVNWPIHAQPVAVGKNPGVPTAQSLAAQNVSYSAKDATLAASEDTATTVRAPDVGAPADSGSKSCDSKSSKSSGGILSMASTQDFHAQLQLQLGSEKNDAHLDNLTGLNDMVGSMEKSHGEGPQEEKKARTT